MLKAVVNICFTEEEELQLNNLGYDCTISIRGFYAAFLSPSIFSTVQACVTRQVSAAQLSAASTQRRLN